MTVGRTKALIGRAFRNAANLRQDTAAVLERDPEHRAPVDALTALGRLKEPAGASVLHARLGGEEAHGVKLVLVEWAVIEFDRRGWKVATRKYPEHVTMWRFIEQVWREFGGRPCGRCAGTRYVHRDAKVKPCKVCDATGKVRPSLRARAQALGVSPTLVAKVWRERFAVVMGEMRRIERAALFECANYLYGDDEEN